MDPRALKEGMRTHVTELPTPATQTVLTVDQVAELLGLDRKTVYTAVANGELPSRRLGRRILIPTASFVMWLGGDDSVTE